MTHGHARSIRDIAHLYITKPRDDCRAVVVAGVDAETFPGFHVANLAAALSVLGRRVRVVERSGLLLNAARFLAMPPQVYAASRRSGVSPSVSALDGVDVWFAEPPPAGQAAVDLIHAPPLSVRSLEDRSETAGLVVIARDPRDIPRGLVAAHRETRCLQVAWTPRTDTAPPVPLLGIVSRWERSLCDVLPSVIRDRSSRLSRAFIECARSLQILYRERRIDHGTRAGENRAAAR